MYVRKERKYLQLNKLFYIFAAKNMNNMAGKRYPENKENGIDVAGEPLIGYTATGSGYANTVIEDNYMLPNEYDPGLGPYTMKELNARIDKAEQAIERAENGDERDWVTSEEMDTELLKMFPWLK